MTKKELLEMEAFKALPDDAQIVFKTSKDIRACAPLTHNDVWYERRCTNIEYIQSAPPGIKERIKPNIDNFLIIDAMPFYYMEKELNMTFEL